MSADLEARIREIEDFLEISNLQSRYSYLIDSLRMEELVDLFADEFVWEGGFDRDSMKSVTSKAELLALFNGAAESTSMMRHMPTTPHIEVDGDNAKGTWYVFGMMTAITPSGEIAKWIQGTLHNEFVRIDGEWKFSRKSTIYNFNTPYEVSWAESKNSADLFDDSDTR